MKKQLAKLGLIVAISASLSAVSFTAEAAYRCAWRDGQRVCWYTSGNYNYNKYNYKSSKCYWVKGHWYRGHWYPAKKVCRNYRYR